MQLSANTVKSKCSQGQAQSIATAGKFSEVMSGAGEKVQSSINQVQSSPSAAKSSVVVEVQSKYSQVPSRASAYIVKCKSSSSPAKGKHNQKCR